MTGRALPILFATAYLTASTLAAEELPPLSEVRITSSMDGSSQPSLLWAPERAKSEPTPLFIWLHSWSFNNRQPECLEYQKQAVQRDWIFVLPNFRGRNDNPQAGGSELARGDIIDVLDYVEREYHVDKSRVYLGGGSGGGHMALLMAGYHPNRFSAVSAWVPITDLADWYRFHSRPGGAERYAKGVLAVCGGPPGTSPAVDAEYRARSPIYQLDGVNDLHLDLVHGVRDTSVPFAHSLDVYNRLAAIRGEEQISDAEIEELKQTRHLAHPRESDVARDPSLDYEVLLRRHAGSIRVTIFSGGHVGDPKACCSWLAEQQRKAN